MAIEIGWRCPVPGRRCFPICGDGVIVGTETCDDGNQVSGDGCSAICLVEPSAASCGDHAIEGAEQCDDGSDNGLPFYGGCTTDCRFGGYCGDGAANGFEDCDFGEGRNIAGYGATGGCAPGCRFPHFCGDGVVDESEGEQCDLGVEQRDARLGVHGRLQDHHRPVKRARLRYAESARDRRNQRLRSKPAADARLRAAAVRAHGPQAIPARIAAASDPSGISTPSSDRNPSFDVSAAHAPVPIRPSTASTIAASNARRFWL